MQKLFLILACVLPLTACGDGAFKRITTFSGVFTVDSPDGYPVVCFIEAEGGGIFCIPKTQLPQPPATAEEE